MTGDNDTVIYTMENHDETALSTQVTDAIEKANLTLESTSLLLNGSVPEDCSLLISYGASKDLTDDELTLIREYLDSGGQVMFVLAQTEEEMPNWETLMAEYGLTLADGAVLKAAGGKRLSMTVDGVETPVQSGAYIGKIVLSVS